MMQLMDEMHLFVVGRVFSTICPDFQCLPNVSGFQMPLQQSTAFLFHQRDHSPMKTHEKSIKCFQVIREQQNSFESYVRSI